MQESKGKTMMMLLLLPDWVMDILISLRITFSGQSGC
jgi:type III secretory pathway component EscV